MNDKDADRQVQRAYRSATQALNETPSASVRATVLAAAARAVQARPTGVAANGVAPVLRGKPRYRMPLAAAASVLVGTIAVLLAQRTDENMLMPGESTSVAVRADEAPAAVAPAAPKVTEPARVSGPADSAARADAPSIDARAAADAMENKTAKADRQRLAQAEGAVQHGAREKRDLAATPASDALESRPESAAKPVAAADSKTESGREQIRRADSTETQRPAKQEAAASLPGESNVVAGVTAPPPAMLRERVLAQAAERETDAPAAPASLRKVARNEDAARAPQPAPAVAPPPADRVTARPVQRTAPVSDPSGAVALTAQLQPAEVPAEVAADFRRWIERIVRLRAEGRNELADAELKALRIRHPDAVIPPAALR